MFNFLKTLKVRVDKALWVVKNAPNPKTVDKVVYVMNNWAENSEVYEFLKKSIEDVDSHKWATTILDSKGLIQVFLNNFTAGKCDERPDGTLVFEVGDAELRHIINVLPKKFNEKDAMTGFINLGKTPRSALIQFVFYTLCFYIKKQNDLVNKEES